MNHPDATSSPRYVTLAEAADYAGFSVRTIRRYISQGLLTGYRVGPKHIRIDLNEVDGMFSAIPTTERARSARDMLAAELTGDADATYESVTVPTQNRIDRIIAISEGNQP